MLPSLKLHLNVSLHAEIKIKCRRNLNLIVILFGHSDACRGKRRLTHLKSDVLSGSVEEAHIHNHSLLDLRTDRNL